MSGDPGGSHVIIHRKDFMRNDHHSVVEPSVHHLREANHPAVRKVTEDDIASLAYELWENNKSASPLEHWLEAERLLNSQQQQ